MSGLGFTRIQAGYGESQGDVTDAHIYQLIWDQQWDLPTDHGLSTTVDLSLEGLR